MNDIAAKPVHPSEGQHWYYADGRPAYTVPSADGKRMIEPDVRHARKLGLLPGVSSIIRCADRPALNLWREDQVLLAALTLPRLPGESEVNWIKRVKEDAKQQSIKAAEKGTAIHAAIQSAFEGAVFDLELLPFVRAAQSAVGYCDESTTSWQPEESFAHELGFGCKIDLKNDAWCIDFKTKEFAEAPTKENKVRLHWDEMAMQLAANRVAAGMPTALCANVFISTSVPGLTHTHVWEEEEIQRAWGMFQGLLAYWRAKNKYGTQ